MIAKIFKARAGFPGVDYNNTKINKNKGELIKANNFGLLREFTSIRPEDYKHFLNMLSSLSKRVKLSEFHAMISPPIGMYNKFELTQIAEKYLNELGYGDQPYLLIYHRDTKHDHVHMVTSRVNFNGKKINDSFEKLRSRQVMNRLMGLDEKHMIEKAKQYHFTTVPQFNLILEKQGFIFKDKWIIRSGKKVAEFNEAGLKFSEPDQARTQQLRAIFQKYRGNDLESILKEKFGVELVFHSKDGKPAYGYTVIDHAQKNVFKGSEIMRLNELLTGESKPGHVSSPKFKEEIKAEQTLHFDINIAKDVDDEAVHRRRRKKKLRTNLR